MIGQNPKRTVAVNVLSFVIDKQSPVGVSIKSHTEVGLFSNYSLFQPFDMQRATILVDVLPVRLIVNSTNSGAQTSKQCRSQRGTGAIGTVDHNPEIA